MRDEPRRGAGTSTNARRGAAATGALLPPLLGIALTLALFHPGLLSPDSALQYAQALGLQPLDDVHPPLFALLWRASDALWPGPGGAASAWANALPLWLLSGSSEFRYVLWTVLAALLATLFAGTDDNAAEPAMPHPTTAPARFSGAGYD